MPRSILTLLSVSLGLSLAGTLPAAAAWQLDSGADFEMVFVLSDQGMHEFAIFCGPGDTRNAYLGVKVPAGTAAPQIATVTASAPNRRQAFTSPARVAAVPGWVYAYFVDGAPRINQLILLAEAANPTIAVSMALANGQVATGATFSARGSDRQIDQFLDRCRQRFAGG